MEKTSYPIEDHKPVSPAEEKLMEDLEGYSFPSLDLAYSEAKEMIEFQFEQAADLDGKASILIGFAGVILSILFTSLSYLSKLGPDTQLKMLLSSGALIVFFSGFAALRAYKPRTYVRPSSIKRLWEEYIQWHPRNFKYQMIGDALPIAFEENEPRIKHKVLWLQVSFASVTVGLVALSFAFLYSYLQCIYVFYVGVSVGLLLAVCEAIGMYRLWRREDNGSGE